MPPISLCVCTCIPLIFARQRLGKVYPSLTLLGNGSVNRFSRQGMDTTIEELLYACVCGSANISLYHYYERTTQRFTAATKNCLRNRYLCSQHRIKGKQTISSSQNLFVVLFFRYELCGIYCASDIWD
jgi:hypothetical protein